MLQLPKDLILIQNITQQDFDFIQETIKNTDLSYYLLNPKDFFVIKDTKEQIIAFGRLYQIEKNAKEISSVRVHPDWRGHKLWLYITEKLIQHKKWNDDIYLATKPSLSSYYGTVWFKGITKDIPEKLIHTGIRAKEHDIEFVIMKYVR